MKLALSILFIIIVNIAAAQGCSDAGMCTIDGLNSGFNNESKSNSLSSSLIIGLGEQNVVHADIEVNVEYQTFKNQVVQLKVPFRTTIGNLGTVAGLGDLILSLNQKIITNDKLTFLVVGGVKIPSNSANKELNGNPLPMAYQTSLGTYDMILGAGLFTNKWHFSFGYQHSFGNNLNEFLHSDSNPQYFNNYQESFHLKRADDIMARIERKIKLKKSTLIFGVLPIYHLSNDEINDGQVVPNSKGLTLNLNAKMNMDVGNNTKLNLMLAAPIIDKENRPDGLTRSFVVSATLVKRLM